REPIMLSNGCGNWAALRQTTNTLSASNQSLAGNCKINSLSVQPTPAFVVNP
ncbi:protein activator, partial [Pseudomonas aeruginosa]